MTTRVLAFVADWSTCVFGCLAIVAFCCYVSASLIEFLVRSIHYHGVVIDWIFHRKEFKAWLAERRAKSAARQDHDE